MKPSTESRDPEIYRDEQIPQTYWHNEFDTHHITKLQIPVDNETEYHLDDEDIKEKLEKWALVAIILIICAIMI